MPSKGYNPELDKMIIEALSAGLTQYEISELFKSRSIKPNGLRTIEDRINVIKAEHKANTLFHLAVILKRKGLC